MQGRERGLEFKVGVLLVVSSAILLLFIFVLGNFSLRSGFTIHADFDYVGSLKPGAPVKVSGIKVGKVEEVAFWGGRQDAKLGDRVQVRVTVWIEDRVRESIRQDSELFINTAGMLGEQYLEIVPGRDWERPPIAAGTVIHDSHRVHDPPRTDLVVARLYDVLDGVSSVLQEDRESIKRLLSNSANAVAELNDLLSTRKQAIGDLITATTGVASEARITLAKVNAGLGDGKPVAKLLADADAALEAARTTMTTLTPAAQAFLTDATRVTGLVTEQRVDRALVAVDHAGAAADRATGLVENVNALVSGVREGRGTAGALLAREELYSDLRELIRDLKRNPWKLFWKE
ncbi:MAG TPA: MlaD family protein [Kofleriaceae bacterium]